MYDSLHPQVHPYKMICTNSKKSRTQQHFPTASGETAGAVCHTFVTLSIPALACNDFVICKIEQCHKKRFSLHITFLIFEKRDVFPASRCRKWAGNTSWAGDVCGGYLQSRTAAWPACCRRLDVVVL